MPPTLRRRFWFSTAIASAAVLAVAALGGYGVAYVRRSAQVLVEAKRDLGALEKRRNEIDAAVAALKRLDREARLIQGAFPSPADPLPFIERIEGLGRRAGVRVDLALAPGTGGALGEEYVLKANGSFRRVMSFFQNLEALPFLVTFGDATLRAGAGAAPAGVKQPPEPAIELIVAPRMVRP